MPFKKNGFPVVGSFGAKTDGVVIIRASDWTRLCQEIPELGTRQFEVGSHED